MADNFDLFKTAPRDVTNYFNAKKSRPSFDWRDIAPEEHAFSWTVAKSAGFDILDDIRSAMQDAISNQTSFEHFRSQLTPLLQKKGWWGKRFGTDPVDSVTKLVQLGSPRRLRTIYWANIHTAYAAGQWAKTQRTKRFLPFLVYLLSVSRERRLEHEDWVGIVLPVDHPFWDTHYPPNGWGCKCRIRQISEREARRLGWSENQAAPIVVERIWRNKRTGQVTKVPEGIDPGWETNPGKLRASNVSEFLQGKVNHMPPSRQQVAISDIVNSPLMEAMAKGLMSGGVALPVAQVSDSVKSAFQSKTRLVKLSDHSVNHILAEHVSRNLTTDDFRDAISVLNKPSAVIRRGNAAVVVGVVSGTWWRTVIKSANNGLEWWMVSFHRKSENDVRSFIRASIKKNNIIE